MNHIVATLLGHLQLRFPGLDRPQKLGNDRLTADGLQWEICCGRAFANGQRRFDLDVQTGLGVLFAFVQDVEVVRSGTGQVNVAVVIDVPDREVLGSVRI